MAKGINKVTLVGHLGADPDVRYGNAGSVVTKLSVATTDQWKDKQTGERKERTEWHRVTMFGKLAEIAGEYLRKGGLVYIEGSLRTGEYIDKSGIRKFGTDIIASEMQMLGGKPSGNQQPPAAQPPQANQAVDELTDDDIPF